MTLDQSLQIIEVDPRKTEKLAAMMENLSEAIDEAKHDSECPRVPSDLQCGLAVLVGHRIVAVMPDGYVYSHCVSPTGEIEIIVRYEEPLLRFTWWVKPEGEYELFIVDRDLNVKRSNGGSVSEAVKVLHAGSLASNDSPLVSSF